VKGLPRAGPRDTEELLPSNPINGCLGWLFGNTPRVSPRPAADNPPFLAPLPICYGCASSDGRKLSPYMREAAHQLSSLYTSFMSSKRRLSRSEVQALYSTRTKFYNSFISAFLYPQGIRALLQTSDLLRPGLRVLDAGCGSGVVTFALMEALRRRNLAHDSINAFDLTPAMLSRFQTSLDARGIADVRLHQADVLALQRLPPSWVDYDLILSASMLEYLPKEDLPVALAELRKRLSPNGSILILITRKSPEAKILVEWCWGSERYSREELHKAFAAGGFQNLTFRRFPARYFWLNRSLYAAEARPNLFR
jgi:ubiquinone/menaquinone biosynthesis C-methylase UbiE